MVYVSPVIVMAAGLIGAVWFAVGGAPITCAFFCCVAAGGAYELQATFFHERAEGSDG